MNAKANFKLAPDIIVMRKNFLRNYQSSVPYNNKVPRSLSWQDIINICEFLVLIWLGCWLWIWKLIFNLLFAGG